MRIMATADLHGNLDGLGPTGADVDSGSSRIYNVSRLDERYGIAYDPTWLDV